MVNGTKSSKDFSKTGSRRKAEQEFPHELKSHANPHKFSRSHHESTNRQGLRVPRPITLSTNATTFDRNLLEKPDA